MTAPVWELIEYAGFLFFGHDAQDIANGVKDSMEDMFFCLVVAMILSLIFYVLDKFHLTNDQEESQE